MALAPTYIGLWDPSRPGGSESRTESDNYHRNFAKTVQDSLPNVTGPVTSTHQDLNTVSGLNALGTKPLPGVGGQTVVYFYLATPPPGYAPVTPDGNVRNLTIGGTGGTIGGADNPTNLTINTSVTVNLPANTGNHVLTVAQMPSHDHDITTGNVTGGQEHMTGSFILGTNTTAIQPRGGNQPHSHPLGGTANGSGTDTLTPRHAMGVLGQLNA